MRIKLFDNVSRPALEHEVNDFLELNCIETADIQYNTYINERGAEIWTVMVVY